MGFGGGTAASRGRTCTVQGAPNENSKGAIQELLRFVGAQAARTAAGDGLAHDGAEVTTGFGRGGQRRGKAAVAVAVKGAHTLEAADEVAALRKARGVVRSALLLQVEGLDLLVFLIDVDGLRADTAVNKAKERHQQERGRETKASTVAVNSSASGVASNHPLLTFRCQYGRQRIDKKEPGGMNRTVSSSRRSSVR